MTRSMKFGILTQPLGHNYGGILQNYALQEALRQNGVLAETINLTGLERKRSASARTALKQSVVLSLKKLARSHVPDEDISRPLFEFISQNILLTKAYKAPIRKEHIDEHHYDGYIVGSDQVWRPSYSPNLLNYFLDFTQNSHVKRIAFAASFGNAEAEYDSRLLEMCTPLIREFNAVSVRENTAISSCQHMFGISAKLVCDPTLLLSQTDYQMIIERESTLAVPEKLCVCYFLNPTIEKWDFASTLSSQMKLTPTSLLPKYFAKSQKEEAILSPSKMLRVPDWLAFMDKSSMILTDSFHGTVFSLIFKKPFWVFNNHARGADRIPGLLDFIGLSERILDSNPEYAKKRIEWNAPIDWDRVWRVLNAFICESDDFLSTAIK